MKGSFLLAKLAQEFNASDMLLGFLCNLIFNFHFLFVDINECNESENPCLYGNCVNQVGSFRCECTKPGTALDSTGRVCLGELCIFLLLL